MKNFLSIFTLLAFFSLYAQSKPDNVVYYDLNWEETTEDKAFYYSVNQDVDKSEPPYRFVDYYISGEKQMEGQYLDKKREKETGKFVWYYKNGTVSSITHYENGKPTGIKKRYYQNGNINSEIEEGGCLLNAWDENGEQITTNGNGLVHIINKEGETTSKAQLQGGLRHGRCVGVVKNPKSSFTETYEDGELKMGVSVDSVGNRYVYKSITQVPEFSYGGREGFKLYTQHNLIVSPVNKDVVIKVLFTVMPDGSVTNVKLADENPKGYKELKKNILKCMSESPTWNPHLARGIPMKSTILMPFTIRSDEKP